MKEMSNLHPHNAIVVLYQLSYDPKPNGPGLSPDQHSPFCSELLGAGTYYLPEMESNIFQRRSIQRPRQQSE